MQRFDVHVFDLAVLHVMPGPPAVAALRRSALSNRTHNNSGDAKLGSNRSQTCSLGRLRHPRTKMVRLRHLTSVNEPFNCVGILLSLIIVKPLLSERVWNLPFEKP